MRVNIDNAYAEDFQSALGHGGASRPELPDIRSLLACFRDITGIDGDSFTTDFGESHFHHRHIELQPVEFALEKLTESLFATVAITSHPGEIYLSWYDHV